MLFSLFNLRNNHYSYNIVGCVSQLSKPLEQLIPILVKGKREKKDVIPKIGVKVTHWKVEDIELRISKIISEHRHYFVTT